MKNSPKYRSFLLKTLAAIFAFSVVVLTFMAMPSQASPLEKIRITNGEWAPFMSEDLPHYGIISRIITEAFYLEGIEVEYGFFPWKRSYALAERGQWDGTAGWIKTAEREHHFFFSDPVVDSGYVFFYRKDEPFDWNHITDLKGKKIGGTLEYNYGEAFTQAEMDNILFVERVPEERLNFKKLLSGRIDLFPMNLIVGLDMMNKHLTAAERAQIAWHAKPLLQTPAHLLLSKAVNGNEEKMRRFNRALKKLQQSGAIERYLQEFSDTSNQP